MVAQHAFSRVLASGRPDQTDMEKIEEFAMKIVERIGTLKTHPQPIDVKGTNPPEMYILRKDLMESLRSF